MLSVEEPEPVTEAGLNDEVAPLGRPLTPRVTVLLNPLEGVMLAV